MSDCLQIINQFTPIVDAHEMFAIRKRLRVIGRFRVRAKEAQNRQEKENQADLPDFQDILRVLSDICV